MMQWERRLVQDQIAFAEKTSAAKVICELELFFAGETMRKGYEYEKVVQKLQELRQKYVEER